MMTLLRYLLGQCRPAWRLTTAGAGMRPLDFLGKPVIVPFPGRPKTQFHIFHQAENAGSDSSERAPRPQVSASDFSRDGSGQSEAPKRAIRVAIVEDESTVRENLAALLKGAPDIECVAACPNADDALSRLPALKPNVVLMDIRLPGRDGIQCTAELRNLLPETEIIMLTIEEDGERVFESMKSGATGYLVKHSTPEEILDAIAEVHRGGAPMSSVIARKVVSTFRKPPSVQVPDNALSSREEDVLRLISKGYRTKEIARALDLKAGTINTYVRKIYRKLEVRSRAEAVAQLRKK